MATDTAIFELPSEALATSLSDSRTAELGAALEAGDPAALATGDLLAGAPYIVDFCDPSPATPLHAGYLRNIALGHATASALAAAGAHVARQTQIADAGPDMGAAMAGCTLHPEEVDPATAGCKSDHFVGRMHALYAREPRTAAPGEGGEKADLAHSLLVRLGGGDREMRGLWQTVRDWTVSGQNETLARLGVRFDRTIFDSQYAPRIEPLVRLALAQGVVSGSPQGPLQFAAGAQGRPRLPLVGYDGFPTRDLRALTIWRSLMTEMTDVTMIRLTSEERRDNLDEILHGLAPGAKVYPTAVLHAEVLPDQDIAVAHGERTLLIDELLDILLDDAELRALEIDRRPSCGVQDLAVMVLLGMCLDHPLNEPLTLTPERLLDRKGNVGWTLARAWMKAWDPENDGQPLPQPDDELYRSIVGQSQLHRPLLDHAVKNLDIRVLVRFLGRIGTWYLDRPADPSVGRVMRTLLRSGLTSLGLLRAPEFG
jgi:hypothetical protein